MWAKAVLQTAEEYVLTSLLAYARRDGGASRKVLPSPVSLLHINVFLWILCQGCFTILAVWSVIVGKHWTLRATTTIYDFIKASDVISTIINPPVSYFSVPWLTVLTALKIAQKLFYHQDFI